MGDIVIQWNMDWIEAEIANKVNADTDVLQNIFDQLETIDVNRAMTLSEDTCFRDPVFVTDEGQSTFVGWQKVLPALKSRWKDAGSPPIAIKSPRVEAAYIPYDSAPSPGEDKDIKIDVSIALPFSKVIGTFFHRRICTLG